VRLIRRETNGKQKVKVIQGRKVKGFPFIVFVPKKEVGGKGIR